MNWKKLIFYSLVIMCLFCLNSCSSVSNFDPLKILSILKTACYGGSNTEILSDIIRSLDNGWYVTGYSFSQDGDVDSHKGLGDYWILKLNNNLEIQWQKDLGGSSSDIALSSCLTKWGGILVGGVSSSDDWDVIDNYGSGDCWLVKIANDSVVEWDRNYGGTESDKCSSIDNAGDDGYIFVADSFSSDRDVSQNHGLSDYWVVRLNNAGDIVWEKSFGGSNYDWCMSVQETSDGGFIIGGTSGSNDGDKTVDHGTLDYWIIKLDHTGALQWEKSLGGSLAEWCSSVKETVDGGYIVIGESESNDGNVSGNHGDFDFWVVKLDKNGNIRWQKSLGGSGEDRGNDIFQTSEGGYLACGVTTSNDGDVSGKDGVADGWLVKLSAIGEIQWQKTFGGSGIDRFKSIESYKNKFLVAGETNSNDGDVTGNHGFYDYWIVMLE